MNIKEVAKRAGVSISTVSRVINNTAKVNQETRDRVEKIIRETGYIPNSLAKALQQNKTNTVGLILSTSDLSTSSLSHTIDAITDVMKQHQYNIMIANSRFHVDEELASFNTFKEKRVDGIFYFAAQFTPAHYELFEHYNIPIVMIGQTNDQLTFPHVVHDDYNAAITATNYLIDMGHENIAFIGLPGFDEATGGDRIHGYHQALEDHHLPLQAHLEATGDFSFESGYQGLKQIWEGSNDKPTALFAATDVMAIGAMAYAHEIGLDIPNDLSVIGFDDVPMAAYAYPPLTTIQSDSYNVGKKAAEILLEMIDLEHSHHHTVDSFIASYHVVERASVKKIK